MRPPSKIGGMRLLVQGLKKQPHGMKLPRTGRRRVGTTPWDLFLFLLVQNLTIGMIIDDINSLSSLTQESRTLVGSCILFIN